MQDLILRSQLFYSLHEVYLVLQAVSDYHIPLDKISLDILIEHCKKIIKT
jgi:metal-sulfur cluster biosynthetic enzyme